MSLRNLGYEGSSSHIDVNSALAGVGHHAPPYSALSYLDHWRLMACDEAGYGSIWLVPTQGRMLKLILLKHTQRPFIGLLGSHNTKDGYLLSSMLSVTVRMQEFSFKIRCNSTRASFYCRLSRPPVFHISMPWPHISVSSPIAFDAVPSLKVPPALPTLPEPWLHEPLNALTERKQNQKNIARSIPKRRMSFFIFILRRRSE